MTLTTRQTTPPPRFGVEEEFLVVDAVTRAPAPRAAEVVGAASALLGERVSGEITTLQLETRTDACETLGELAAQLAEARKVVADCARTAGLRVVATGTAPVAGVVPPPMTVGPRQSMGNETYRGLHDELALCALHVHVEMPSRQRAVLVGNHLRPYLPLLLSLTANSPYWDDRDSGYASWRTTVWGRWPVAGPPPVFDSAEHYDEVVQRLLDVGALVDRATIFWDVRPSERHPTLEVRVADSAVTAEDSARYAALVRAMVVHLSAAVEAGEPAPDVAGELLRAAYWRAARDGLDGEGVDPRTGRLRPATALARDLLDIVEPVLRAHGEHDLVGGWLERLGADGTGARHQRSVARRGGTLADVVDHLAEQTAG